MNTITKFISWFLFLVGYHKECEHKRYVLKQYFDPDGTPMIYWHCFDCHSVDRGHVHGNPEQMRKDGWEKEECVGFMKANLL